MSGTLKMLKPSRRTASLLLQHMVDKLPKTTHAPLAVNNLLNPKKASTGVFARYRTESEVRIFRPARSSISLIYTLETNSRSPKQLKINGIFFDGYLIPRIPDCSVKMTELTAKITNSKS